jgi:hypothetical protein
MQAETFGSLFGGQVNDSSISDTQFVTNLYEAFLQRGPDAGGLGWWSGQATVGTERQNVLGAFATCPAFRDLSGTLYREANWLVSDHLGTPRMIANKSGSLASLKRHDYLPFGEELSAGTGDRTTTQGYSGDSMRRESTSREPPVSCSALFPTFGLRSRLALLGFILALARLCGLFVSAIRNLENKQAALRNSKTSTVLPASELRILSSSECVTMYQ